MTEMTTHKEQMAVDAVNPQDRLDETPRVRGNLKIFLSYAPGTGKTLAMLEDAYRRQLDGVDVVAAYVDARGDMLALNLFEKFEILPQHVVGASGISYQGMNLDLVLRRRPQLALVDNLARVNPPGLRHEARFLEVEELLNAGIDVYTTLDVYQIESQRDAVATLTGVEVRDIVPDRLIDDTDEFHLVDMPPQELLEQYAAGRVSVAPRVRMQLEKFFQPGNLFALRELVLRYMARRSNLLMRAYFESRGLPALEASSQRLLVCISESENAGRLIRAGRRMADETKAEWTVIHVETPGQLDIEREQASVASYMRLADMLGAQTAVVPGVSVVDTIREYARKNHIHRIMVGRSTAPRWSRLLKPNLAEQLLRKDPSISVHVFGAERSPRPFHVPRFWRWISRMQLLGSLALVALPTLIGLALFPAVISRSANQVMLYILSVVIASVFLGPVPALLTALLSMLAYDYFFIPPVNRLFLFAPEHWLTFAGLLTISILTSTLVSRQRALTLSAQQRADQVTQLYEFSRDLATAVDMNEVLSTILKHVQETFDREMVIFLPRDGQLVLSASNAGGSLDSSEMTAAEWAFQQGRPAGHSTGTFAYASFRYFPLETSSGIIGVMGVRMMVDKPDLHPEQVRQLGVYVTKAASSIERALFAEEASQTEILRATEKLQTALLNSISHDLRTPLASITGVLDTLRFEEGFLDAESRRELVETAYGEAGRLNRLVGNLLDMSRLESGSLRISLQPGDVQDVISSALDALASRLDGHPIRLNFPQDVSLVPMDYVLINQVLINLLDNAAKYSPETGQIDINVSYTRDSVLIAVEDRGPGIPEEDLGRIFEKFYRVKRFENVVGTGLGLSICKGIVEAHGGKIWAENRPGGGGKLAFSLPAKTPRPAAQTNQTESLHEEVKT